MHPMMVRTTIMLPADLRRRSALRARELGVSLGELVRASLAVEVKRGKSLARGGRDPLFADDAVYEGPGATDSAAEHDRYLYDDRR
jgi:hypothetical protein